MFVVYCSLFCLSLLVYVFVNSVAYFLLFGLVFSLDLLCCILVDCYLFWLIAYLVLVYFYFALGVLWYLLAFTVCLLSELI